LIDISVFGSADGFITASVNLQIRVLMRVMRWVVRIDTVEQMMQSAAASKRWILRENMVEEGERSQQGGRNRAIHSPAARAA
jgi:hypothetical protein